ncbi:MAG: hypothetical protein QXP42_05990 [Candidatus Micrarchaeia archaeon]
MGFSKSAAELALFIGALMLVTLFSKMAEVAAMDFVGGIKDMSGLFESKSKTAIKIINHPKSIEQAIYVKNIGKTILSGNFDVLIDGIHTPYSSVRIVDNSGNDIGGPLLPGRIAALNFTSLPQGEHVVYVIAENGVSDRFFYIKGGSDAVIVIR